MWRVTHESSGFFSRVTFQLEMCSIKMSSHSFKVISKTTFFCIQYIAMFRLSRKRHSFYFFRYFSNNWTLIVCIKIISYIINIIIFTFINGIYLYYNWSNVLLSSIQKIGQQDAQIAVKSKNKSTPSLIVDFFHHILFNLPI